MFSKISKLIPFAFLIMFGTGAFSQEIITEEWLHYYNKGSKMFEEGKFVKADSLFSYSLRLKANRDTYYNLALTRFHLGDTCAFCDNLKNAEKLGDYEAGTMFDNKCITKRKINFDNSAHPDSIFYAIFFKSNCTKKISKRKYFITNVNSRQTSMFTDFRPDTSETNPMIIPGAFPNLMKFEPEYQDTNIYSVVEIMPSFPGGDDARIHFLATNMIYPKAAKEKGIQGTVYITFVVEKDGSVSDVSVLRGIGGGCDEEAVRIVKQLPKWTPAYQNGKPVRVQFFMPIRFSLN